MEEINTKETRTKRALTMQELRSTYAKLLDDTVGREMEKAEEKER